MTAARKRKQGMPRKQAMSRLRSNQGSIAGPGARCPVMHAPRVARSLAMHRVGPGPDASGHRPGKSGNMGARPVQGAKVVWRQGVPA